MTPDPIPHRGGCSRPAPDVIARDGRTKTTCPECRAYSVREQEPEPVRLAVDKTAADVAPWSPWRCREHHDVPVSRSGAGCRTCDRTRAQGRQARAKRRRDLATARDADRPAPTRAGD